MKVSEINLEIVEQYLALDLDIENPVEIMEIQAYIDGAKSYVYQYTKLSKEEVDEREYLTMPVLIMIANFYENKSLDGTRFVNDLFKRFIVLDKVIDL